MLKRFFLPLLLGISVAISAQDPHLSYYQASSPFFNPSTSGDFRGFVKAGSSLRTQYERTWEQGITHADANFFSPLSKKHWISIGVQLVYDVAGRLKYRQTGGGLQAAYHMPIDKKGKRIISVGMQWTTTHFSVNTAAYHSEFTILSQEDPDLIALRQFQASIPSLGFGLGFRNKLSKTTELSAGVAVMHLNQPEYKVLKHISSLGRRFNAHAGIRTSVGKQLTLSPAVNYSNTENFTNTNIQFVTEYKLKPKNDWAVMAGINHRLGESASLLTGYTSDKMMLCLNIDILTGQSGAVVDNPGALEISGYYIFNRYTRPEVKPVVLCPRL